MKAYELLDSPEKWTQKIWAKDSLGDPCMWNQPSACCWCLHGAVSRCYQHDWPLCEIMLDTLVGKIPGKDLWGWNDAPERTYEEVVGLLRELDI